MFYNFLRYSYLFGVVFFFYFGDTLYFVYNRLVENLEFVKIFEFRWQKLGSV